MMTPTRPILLDVTRLIATGWMKQQATGIDRVCDAYLEHYRHQAHAVVQFKGVFRVLSAKHSAKLFKLLANRDKRFRFRLSSFIVPIIAAGKTFIQGSGRIYINVSHTDFDLKSHQEWVQRCNLKPVYMIHDLIPINNKAYCTPHASKRHEARVKKALNHAAGIIVNSKATASDLGDYANGHGINMPPIVASHLGSEDFHKMRDVASHNSSNMTISAKPYFVTVGTIERRKNHMLLLRVWIRLISKMKSNTPQLIIIGRWGRRSEAVRELLKSDVQLSKYVTVMDKCSDAESVRWVNSAKAVLLPTLAEGYGLPLIEAMALETPVIASDLPCFREIGGNTPLLIDASDENAWEEAILNFLNESVEENRQAELLSEFVAPQWGDHFSDIDNWLESLKGENLLKEAKHSCKQHNTVNSSNVSHSDDDHPYNVLDGKISQYD